MTLGAVSYLNTVPFIYGIQSARTLQTALLLSPPSQCAANFAAGRVDVALVPVAAIPTLPSARIVTRYCLGAVGKVRTVVLVSDAPLDEIRTIYLDFHSLTSARLVQILCRELWHIAPEFWPLTDYSLIEQREKTDAFLLIGDKVFDYEGRLSHSHDLALAWIALTGLPMLFAAWVARPSVPEAFIAELDAALAYGTTHIPEAIAALGHGGNPYASEYLTKNLDYHLDAPKREALQRYWDYAPRVREG